MKTWRGTRRLTVVSACLNAAGCPDLALTEIEVTHAEYADGVHCERVEAQLATRGYEEPFLHFDDGQLARFLVPTVRRYHASLASNPDTASKLTPKETDAAHH